MDRYDDIINMPHHKSKTRKPMPVENRAAQFAPFAALTGYDDAVKETARLTDSRAELDETVKAEINAVLIYIAQHPEQKPEVKITYFRPDDKKTGGAYITVSGVVSEIREFERTVVMCDATEIPIDDIYAIESDLPED